MTLESTAAETRLRQPSLAAFTPVIADIDLDTKVRLLTGATTWRLHSIESAGLRSLALSDGPVGVRGTGEVAGQTSRLFPSPSAIAATWDTHLAGKLGSLYAREARALGIDVVLAPQVNIQRTPVGGRHFECYSEDPLLTSLIASSLIASMQSEGVAACVKHYVANDSETDRTEYIARVDEQAMREVYLAPFEHAVMTASAWSVMAAYNQVDDGIELSPMTEHDHLVNGVLKDEWGFDGVVVSDWMATKRTVESALGGLDLVMPGPDGPWGEALVEAVRDGRVPESVVDEKVARILLLAQRTSGSAPISSGDDDEFLRDLAARSMVVIKRDAAFPVAAVSSVALIGPNAVSAYVLGGGSSTVHPEHVISPVEGFAAALPSAEITLVRGGDARHHLPRLSTWVDVSYLAADGTTLKTERLDEWRGSLGNLPEGVETVLIETDVELAEAGTHAIEVGTLGRYRIELNGEIVDEGTLDAGTEVILNSSINNPDGRGGTAEGPGIARLRAELGVIHADGYGNMVRGELRHRSPGPSIDDEIAEAVEAARNAELAIVIVGTNDEVESEGWDRTTLALPGRQDELVERVLEVAPNAIIVVNAGAPLVLPWLDRANTVLWAWFPGQECGHALADVILGLTEPAGRLPWTLPASEEDVPVSNALPENGVLDYYEGVHVGYRGWEKSGATPAAAFGHGLGWTEWHYDSASEARPTDSGLAIDVTVTNTGSRAGTEVVQVYLEPPAAAAGAIERPVRWLAGFSSVSVAAGASQTVTVDIPRRSLQVWAGGWQLPLGEYRAVIGRSIRDLRLERSVQISAVPDADPDVSATEGAHTR
jgi:beta-glucosidase